VLTVNTKEPLRIPNAAFNEDCTAVVVLHTARYGGNWSVQINPSAPEHGDAPWGEAWTELAAGTPERVKRAATYRDASYRELLKWLDGQAKAAGLRLLGAVNHSDARKFFIVAVAVLGNAAFRPTPGCEYLDETLSARLLAA
jgi:hypothetical protein